MSTCINTIKGELLILQFNGVSCSSRERGRRERGRERGREGRRERGREEGEREGGR